ncbi:hypothetical protein Tco_1316619 [Tanacetum coccineum]
MEMEHYLEYINNDVWKVIQNGNSKKRISTRKDGVIRVAPPPSTKIWEAPSGLVQTGVGKGSDRFQQLLSSWKLLVLKFQIRRPITKFLRALPSAWSNLAMTMRTKPEIDTLSIDDLYNNLRVFEQEIKGASKTSTSAQNVAFVSQSRSSTNKVKSGLTGTFSTCNPSTSSSNIPEREAPAGFADEVIYSLIFKAIRKIGTLLHGRT